MMYRVIIFIITALFIAFAASWLSAQEGVTSITWLGYQAEIDSSALAVAIALLCISGIVIDRLVRALVRWPSLMSAGWQMRRRVKGEHALSLGFVALAAGDNRAAHKQARRAEKLLDKGILTDLLVAQSSYASGDSKAASRYFKKLASDPQTAYFGQLGLMRLHQQDSGPMMQGGVVKEALHAAEKAFALDSTSAEAAQVILKQALHEGEWHKAIDCLKIYLNHSGGHSAAEIARARALYAKLHLQIAEERIAADTTENHALSKPVIKETITLCETALSHCPDFTPAGQRLVALLVTKGDKRAAEKQAAKLFSLRPDFDSLMLLRDVRPDNDGQFISHMMRLSAKSSQSDEGYLAVAQFAISVGIWASASQALSQISEQFITHNMYFKLKAAIAKGLEDEPAHQAALEQAASAPRAPHWQCQACETAAQSYQFQCEICKAPGQMTHRTSGQGHKAVLNAS